MLKSHTIHPDTPSGIKYAEEYIKKTMKQGSIMIVTKFGHMYEVESYNSKDRELRCHYMSHLRQLQMVKLGNVHRIVHN